MNLKLALGLVTVMGLPAVLVSALAQDASPVRVQTPKRNFSSSSEVSTTISGSNSSADTIRSESLFAKPGVYTNVYGVTYAGTARSPEEATLDHETADLARKLGEASSDSERSKIKEQLTERLEKQFDLRQKRHLEEIKSLEAKLKKLKELVDKRQENRREIISKRVDQLLSDAEGLGW